MKISIHFQIMQYELIVNINFISWTYQNPIKDFQGTTKIPENGIIFSRYSSREFRGSAYLSQ